MRFFRTSPADRGVSALAKAAVAAAATSLAVAAGLGGSAAFADPAEDTLAQFNELSRQAEQLTEAMHTAQLDLDAKLAAQAEAEHRHAADLAVLDAARGRLAGYQTSVDRLAAAVYMGGRTDGLNAILTASSPQGLIDTMSVARVMGAEMAAQMTSFRQANAEAARIEASSAASAAEARNAADAAAAVRAELQNKQSQLQAQINVVKTRYLALTAPQRAALASPAVPPPSVLAAPPAESPADIAPLAAVPSPGGGSGAGAVAVQAALTRLGSPYSWGGSGPGAFDCSGLVMWAFQQAGVYLPHSSYALAAGGQPVSLDQIQPGDVVAQYSDASHVGIYIGDGMMVHASTYGIPVLVESIHNAPIYNVRRY